MATTEVAADGNWEVVRSNKTKKTKNEPSQKSNKKNQLDRMPKHFVKDALQKDRSIFDVFLMKNKSNKNQANNSAKSGKSNNSAKSKQDNHHKKNGNVKKKKEPEVKKIYRVEEAIFLIDKPTLEAILTKDQASFPNHPEIWLKDLSSYLNVELEMFPEKDPVFKDKSKDFPFCLLRGDVKKFLISAVRQCPAKVQEQIFQHSINCMLNESSKGVGTYGYRMFIQLLAKEKPEFVMSKLPQYMELLKNHQNRPLRCLSILWAIGQAGFKDLCSGLKIWQEVMISSLGFRTITVASYPVDYLETLLSSFKNHSSAFSAISPREYFNIFDLIHDTNINIQVDLKKKLKSLYPKLKAIAYGNNVEKKLRYFFPSYLSRLTPNCSQAMKTELLSCLITCLGKDPHCFNLWRQMYTKHLKQSGILMKHLLEKWHKISKEVDKTILNETLHYFSGINGNLAVVGKKESCFNICKNLQDKMTKPPFPRSLLIFYLLSITAALFLFDVFKNGSVKNSYTVRFLENYGILAYTEQAWHRIVYYSLKAHVWLKENGVIYYNIVSKNLGPYLMLSWNKFLEFCVYFAETTKVQRQWLYTKLLEGKEWVYDFSPEMWSQIEDYVWLSLTLIKEHSIWLWQHFWHFAFMLYRYISTRISEGDFSIENIQHMMSLILTNVRNVTLTVVQWCGEYFESTLIAAAK